MNLLQWLFILLISIFSLVTCKSLRSDSEGNVPTLFLLGVQKGGSSSLYEFLVKHPLLCGGDIHKEAHFFEKPIFKEGGREYYKAMYNDPKCDGKENTRYIDGTPQMHYFGDRHHVGERIFDFYTESERKKLKFIVILREPVSRDFSWFQHATRAALADGLEFSNIRTFSEQMEVKQKLAGRYIEQLTNFTKYFRRQQLFVLSSAALFQNSAGVMHDVAQFLEVDYIKDWDEPFPHDDHLSYPRFQGLIKCILNHVPELACPFRDLVGAYYNPYNDMLYKWLEKTSLEKPPSEPPFIEFGEDYKKIPCISNAREALDTVIESSDKQTCLDARMQRQFDREHPHKKHSQQGEDDDDKDDDE